MMMRDVPERPLEPAYKPSHDPVCPECGAAAAEDFYFRDGQCIGCDQCVKTRNYLEANL